MSNRNWHTKDLLDQIKSKNILSKAIHIKNIIRNKYFLFLKINLIYKKYI
jgi:hypothetical protein